MGRVSTTSGLYAMCHEQVPWAMAADNRIWHLPEVGLKLTMQVKAPPRACRQQTWRCGTRNIEARRDGRTPHVRRKSRPKLPFQRVDADDPPDPGDRAGPTLPRRPNRGAPDHAHDRRKRLAPWFMLHISPSKATPRLTWLDWWRAGCVGCTGTSMPVVRRDAAG